MHSKLARYLGQLPRQVRWQAELLALETAEEDQAGLIAAATTELDMLTTRLAMALAARTEPIAARASQRMVT